MVVWERLMLSPQLVQATKKLFKTPTRVQTLAIPPIINNDDVIVAAETGAGKTLMYLLPLVTKLKSAESASAYSPSLPNTESLPLTSTKQRKAASASAAKQIVKPFGIVLLPTHELAQQTLAVAKELGHICKFRVSSLSRLSKGGSDLVIGTPQRLLQLQRRRKIGLANLKMLVLDEADTLCDDSFWPDTHRVLRACKSEFVAVTEDKTVEEVEVDAGHTNKRKSSKDVQLIFTGATVTKDDMQTLMAVLPSAKVIATPSVHQLPENIRIRFDKMVGPNAKGERLLHHLYKRRANASTMIFCNSTVCALWLSKFLTDEGVPNVSVHGKLPIEERKAALEEFQKNEASVMVCTDLLARGIDTLEVDHVIMYDFPNDPTKFLHRAGRTGRRAGSEGRVTCLVGTKERKQAHHIQEGIKNGDMLRGGLARNILSAS